jgi:DNA-binding transcriptional regulator YdaS (Cro superfamily)
VELASASGRPREAFALDIGLSKTALQRWAKTSQHRAAAFHHVKVEAAITGPETEPLVVVFPSGARLIGVSWEQVRQLLGVST